MYHPELSVHCHHKEISTKVFQVLIGFLPNNIPQLKLLLKTNTQLGKGDSLSLFAEVGCWCLTRSARYREGMSHTLARAMGSLVCGHHSQLAASALLLIRMRQDPTRRAASGSPHHCYQPLAKVVERTLLTNDAGAIWTPIEFKRRQQWREREEGHVPSIPCSKSATPGYLPNRLACRYNICPAPEQLVPTMICLNIFMCCIGSWRVARQVPKRLKFAGEGPFQQPNLGQF
jgi:hypothetical protein